MPSQRPSGEIALMPLAVGLKGANSPDVKSCVPCEPVTATTLETRQSDANPADLGKSSRSSRGAEFVPEVTRHRKPLPLPLPNNSLLSALKNGRACAPSSARAPGVARVKSQRPRLSSAEAASQRPSGEKAA